MAGPAFDLAQPNFYNANEDFYSRGRTYWAEIPATVDGMLGGYGCISYCDTQGSEAFLKKLLRLKNKPQLNTALDCGAGIGRITKNLLLKYFERVDLAEQNKEFLEEARKIFASEKKVQNFYNIGLQDFLPQPNAYDMIWCQWVLGHLTDIHLLNFLIYCRKSLRENGIIVIKENISLKSVEEDENDSSVTRPLSLYKRIFKLADLLIVRECKQTNFPKNLYPVTMFALRPKEAEITVNGQHRPEKIITEIENLTVTHEDEVTVTNTETSAGLVLEKEE